MPAITDGLALPTAFPIVDNFSVANILLPGKWTLLSATKKFGWRIVQQLGFSGAVVYPKGDELITAKFRGEFWTTIDFLTFKILRKTLLQKPAIGKEGVISAALGINHPELAAMGMDACVVLSVGPLLQSDGGLWNIELEFLQYRPPVVAIGKPGLVIKSKVQPVPRPKDALDIQILKLKATRDALAL